MENEKIIGDPDEEARLKAEDEADRAAEESREQSRTDALWDAEKDRRLMENWGVEYERTTYE